MTKKHNVRYTCSNCGAMASAWAGRCAQCGEWNTLQAEIVLNDPIDTIYKNGNVLKPESVDKLVSHDQARLKTNMPELDNIFGGGIVAGSVSLVAGEPGIGKSTLLLQLAYDVAQSYPVLYISAEESAHQVGMRAKRLGITRPGLQFASSTSADDIASTISKGLYKLVIVDSIQAVACQAISSAD